jgi:DNA-directed RNA polymerase specialized sigma24 family protein
MKIAELQSSTLSCQARNAYSWRKITIMPDKSHGVDTKDQALLKLFATVNVLVRDSIKGFIFQSGGTADDLNDVLQDTILCLSGSRFTDRILNNDIGLAYLSTTARRIWMGELKRRKKEEIIKQFNAESIKIATASDNDAIRYKLLIKHILKLGDDSRRLLISYFEKKSVESTASNLGIKNDAYKKRRGRCIKGLRRSIELDPEYQDAFN